MESETKERHPFLLQSKSIGISKAHWNIPIMIFVWMLSSNSENTKVNQFYNTNHMKTLWKTTFTPEKAQKRLLNNRDEVNSCFYEAELLLPLLEDISSLSFIRRWHFTTLFRLKTAEGKFCMLVIQVNEQSYKLCEFEGMILYYRKYVAFTHQSPSFKQLAICLIVNLFDYFTVAPWPRLRYRILHIHTLMLPVSAKSVIQALLAFSIPITWLFFLSFVWRLSLAKACSI